MHLLSFFKLFIIIFSLSPLISSMRGSMILQLLNNEFCLQLLREGLRCPNILSPECQFYRRRIVNTALSVGCPKSVDDILSGRVPQIKSVQDLNQAIKTAKQL